MGVGESPKAPSTVTPAGDRSVRGCWLSSCLRAPCCPDGLRRFWLRSQLVHQKERGLLTNLSTLSDQHPWLTQLLLPQHPNFSTARKLASETVRLFLPLPSRPFLESHKLNASSPPMQSPLKLPPDTLMSRGATVLLCGDLADLVQAQSQLMNWAPESNDSLSKV